MIENLEIKTYESIDDEALVALIIKNSSKIQKITPEMLIEGAVGKYGYSKIAFFFTFTYFTLCVLLAAAGMGLFQAQISAISMILTTLGLLYGFIFPKFMSKCVKEMQAELIKKDFSDIQRNLMGSGKCLWIATIKTGTTPAKEKIVGSVLVEPYDMKKDFMGLMSRTDIKGEIAELRRMSVDSSMRRLGIGKKLISELKLFCQKHGYGAITLNTLPSNKVAIQVYQKSGYEFWKKLCVKQAPLPFTLTSLVMKL